MSGDLSLFPEVLLCSSPNVLLSSNVSLDPAPGPDLRRLDDGPCWSCGTVEIHLGHVEMPTDAMRRPQQIKKAFLTAPYGPPKIPAIILGNMKDDIVVAAFQSALCEWYRWPSASFGG